MRGSPYEGWRFINDLDKDNELESTMSYSRSAGIFSKSNDVLSMCSAICQELDMSQNRGAEIEYDLLRSSDPDKLSNYVLTRTERNNLRSRFRLKVISNDQVEKLVNITEEDVVKKVALHDLLVISRATTLLDLQDMKPNTRLGQIINNVMQMLYDFLKDNMGLADQCKTGGNKNWRKVLEVIQESPIQKDLQGKSRIR